MTTEMRAKLVMDASQLKAEAVQAGKAIEEMGKRAKDSVASVGQGSGDIGSSLKGMLPPLSMAAGGVALVRAGIAGWGVHLAEANLRQATLTGTTEDVLRAQIRLGESQRQMLAVIPIIGGAIKQVADAWSDREALEAQISAIERMRGQIQETERLARQWARETALQRAKLEGQSEAQIMAIRAGFAEQDRLDAVTAKRQEAAKAAGMVASKEREISEWLDRQTRLSGGLVGNTRDTYEAKLRELNDLRTLAAGVQARAEQAARENADKTSADAAEQRQKVIDAEKTADQQRREALQSADAQAERAFAAVADRLYQQTEAEKRAADERRAYLSDETQQRIDRENEMYEKLRAAAVVNGESTEALEGQHQANLARIRMDAALKVQADEDRRAQQRQALMDREYSEYRGLLDKKLLAAQGLQDRLAGLERGRRASEEAWADKTLRMRLEGQSEARQKELLSQASVRAAREAKAQTDPAEVRRQLERAMGYAEQAGNRKLMGDIMGEIRKSWLAQEAATKRQAAQAKGELTDLNKSLVEIETRARTMKVELDVTEAKARLAELGIGAVVQARLAVGGMGKTMAAGGWAGDAGHWSGGPAGSDTVPAWLDPREFVVRAEAAQRHRALLEGLNRGVTAPARYLAGGGLAGPMAALSQMGGLFGGMPAMGIGGPLAAMTGGFRQYQYHINMPQGATQDVKRQARMLMREIRRHTARGR
jgi:hypothetical protein